jgi:hypothetical protein
MCLTQGLITNMCTTTIACTILYCVFIGDPFLWQLRDYSDAESVASIAAAVAADHALSEQEHAAQHMSEHQRALREANKLQAKQVSF